MTVLDRFSILESDTELRCDDHAVTIGLQRFTDHFFIRVWSINFGGVKKCNASLYHGTDQRNAVLFINGPAVAVAQPHATESQSRNLESTFSKSTFFHVFASTIQCVIS